MFAKSLKVSFAILILMSQMTASPVRADKGDWPDTIRLGLIPTMGRDVVAFYQPLTSHLEKRLGIKVKALSAKDYEGILKGIQYGHIDFVRLGPKSYVEARERFGMEPLLVELHTKGEAGYYGVIIARKDSGMTDIGQAKGRVFAFTDPNSTSGYLVPGIMLSRVIKTDPKAYFKEIRLSGSHKNSILAVRNGSVDLAGVSESQLDRLEEKGEISRDDFVVLKRSELIPGPCICAAKKLPKTLKEAFKNALLEFAKDKDGMSRIDIGGYQPADDKIYDIIRELERMKKK